MAGKPSLPMPKLISTYGLEGCVTASASLSPAASVGMVARVRRSSSGYMNSSYSFQVTSHRPIQKGEILTLCCGPSSGLRPGSLSGLPITNSPPGIGTMAKLTCVPGIVLV